jgi:hypothetical protein
MNVIEELCKGQPEHIQQKIKAAYWQGCVEGMSLANSPEAKIERQEGNVVYLRREQTVEKWEPPEL